MESYRCTEETYRALLVQERALKQELAGALSQLGEAAESDTNTWHDNAAFDATNELIRHLQSRLSSVTLQIHHAVVVSPSQGETIDIGHTVVLDFGEDDQCTVKIVGRRTPDEGHIRQVSADSPLGAALMGKRTGEVVSYSAPRGDITVKVISVK